MELKRYKRLFIENETDSFNEALIDFEIIAKKVARLTANNNHSEALLFIAKNLGFTSFAKVITYIMQITKEQGYLNYNLGIFRNDIAKEMHDLATKKFGKKYEIIRGSLWKN